MDVFSFRDNLIDDYSSYISSFFRIRDERIFERVHSELDRGALWPEPLIQLNPAFERGESVDELIESEVLHSDCSRIFRLNKARPTGSIPLSLHWHQSEAIRIASAGHNYVLTTGTGSGKSLSYIIPIVDHVLRHGSGNGTQAIVVYPMNALANSQFGELGKFLTDGFAEGHAPVTYKRYTGQESKAEKEQIVENPPDILLTNYVMLEYMLTRPDERALIDAAQGLKFLVFDELHTYRGRQGSDVALLIRRVRESLAAKSMQCVGTSATMSSSDSLAGQQADIAKVATTLFGATVHPQHIITERLQRSTPNRSIDDPIFQNDLKQRLASSNGSWPTEFTKFVNDPLAIWIESTFGVRSISGGSDRLVRAVPRSMGGPKGAATSLAAATGADLRVCESAIRDGLLAGVAADKNPETGFPAFAFRLHQFISRGDTVYASLDSESNRYLTLNAQQFVPGRVGDVLLPLVFCRECGQEYYSVWRRDASVETGEPGKYSKRSLEEQFNDDKKGRAGYLFRNESNPWPNDFIGRLPEEWLDPTKDASVKSSMRELLPEPVRVTPSGHETADGGVYHFVPWRLRFCLNCGISYAGRSTDFSKLATLSSEGRSTATTLLSLSAIQQLKGDTSLEADARKLLSFSDNRQDASLQSGHFNDFVEIGLIRCALYRAIKAAGPDGISYEQLPKRVFEALALPMRLYAFNENAKYQALAETHKAMQAVLGYRLYRDLKRGWRITSPNLEQCGLLEIGYASLTEIASDTDLWQGCHTALSTASSADRLHVCKTLLDYLRRELAIEIEYLDPAYEDQLRQVSRQNLISPWSVDDNEELEKSTIAFGRSRAERERGDNVFLSSRSGFGGYLRRPQTFPNMAGTDLKLVDTDIMIADLLRTLEQAGVLKEVVPQSNTNPMPGYKLLARSLVWTAGDGEIAFHDPIRVPRPPVGGSRTNKFFVDFYTNALSSLHGLQAREHTAQVPYELRQQREDDFRKGTLPVLYCSPTMELGVDIARLNVVNMRNIPPTPANYAQRSGRAGRSGQPALVFSYCATGSSHDQYFFKRPAKMVSGVVTPPRLDPANEDLIRAHVHAIWLSEAIRDTSFALGTSLVSILDFVHVNGEPSLRLQEHISTALLAAGPRERATECAKKVMDSLSAHLSKADWFHSEWLTSVFDELADRFDRSCDRWRDLYRSAMKQVEAQDKIIRDPSRSARDKDEAKRLRAEAETQLSLLTDVEGIAQSDFYTYRYLAGEGFLPGYNFPRLPLSAYIPARKSSERNEFVSRARFLAISEFGPRAIIYHEGSRYVINKVILSVEESVAGGPTRLALRRAKICAHCGYLHPISGEAGHDTCEHCKSPLDLPISNLFRLQNVATRRRERINCDEEERMRLGYEIATVVRFASHNGRLAAHKAYVASDSERLVELTFGPSATLWRINMGEARRTDKEKRGFILDVERGYWSKSDSEDSTPDDPMSARKERVVPFVEDTRNSLIFRPCAQIDKGPLLSLQSALKAAIQVEFQMEDSELAAELLPSESEPTQILFYESAEGGAGVLHQLIDDEGAVRRVSRTALQLCHFNADTGEDLRRAEKSDEDCVAACYDCLMTYGNQRNHELLDRRMIRDVLMELSNSTVTRAGESNQASESGAQQADELLAKCLHTTECEWVQFLRDHGLNLPSIAHVDIDAIGVSPDFIYRADGHFVAIYVNGATDLGRGDRDISKDFGEFGCSVLRFGPRHEWPSVVESMPALFGRIEETR
ncbi:MAG TPA: DEAD/DEAH box helicase [Capsulimonadaceae bacterium]|jgi:ATP-dependent helicase YprA (DUF1998 family)